LRKWFKSAVFADPASSSLNLIAGAKKVLTHRDSTVVLDAIACCKPVVLINVDEYNCFYPYNYFHPLAVESSSKEDCLLKLNDIIIKYDGKLANQFIVTGCSSKKIEKLIQESI
jgi:hypothetical protein